MTNYKKGDKLILRKGKTEIHATVIVDSAYDAIHANIDGLPDNVTNGFRAQDFEVEVVKPPFTCVDGMVMKAGNNYYFRVGEDRWFSTFTDDRNPILRDSTLKEATVVYDPRNAR